MKSRNYRNKKAQSHLELILSFLIFLSFVIVLFFVLNPFKTQQTSQTNTDITEENMINTLSINYSKVSLTLKQGIDKEGKDCFKVENLPEVNEKIKAYDSSGNLVPSLLSGDFVLVGFSGNERAYDIYSSSDFSVYSAAMTCKTLNEGDYSFGAVQNYKAILYEKIEQMIYDYGNDYEGLREKLGLTNDFAFYFYDLNGTQIKTLSADVFKPKGTQINARSLPVFVINKNAERTNLILNIRVW